MLPCLNLSAFPILSIYPHLKGGDKEGKFTINKTPINMKRDQRKDGVICYKGRCNDTKTDVEILPGFYCMIKGESFYNSTKHMQLEGDYLFCFFKGFEKDVFMFDEMKQKGRFVVVH